MVDGSSPGFGIRQHKVGLGDRSPQKKNGMWIEPGHGRHGGLCDDEGVRSSSVTDRQAEVGLAQRTSAGMGWRVVRIECSLSLGTGASPRAELDSIFYVDPFPKSAACNELDKKAVVHLSFWAGDYCVCCFIVPHGRCCVNAMMGTE